MLMERCQEEVERTVLEQTAETLDEWARVRATGRSVTQLGSEIDPTLLLARAEFRCRTRGRGLGEALLEHAVGAVCAAGRKLAVAGGVGLDGVAVAVDGDGGVGERTRGHVGETRDEGVGSLGVGG